MQPTRHASHAGPSLANRPALVAIGNFDGVHRGHRALVLAALQSAQARGLEPVVLTFHPHPAEVLGRGARPVLTTIDRKVALLSRFDPALEVVVEPFTLELSRRTPVEFVREFLLDRLGAKLVLVGNNFRFGRDRAGDFSSLRALGEELGFEARSQEMVGDEEGLFSSTRVREALKAGDLQRVEACLGRPHSISGRVVHGAARGRTIGFRTANLDGVIEALPPYGVYACLVDRANEVGEGNVLGTGVMNLGLRPTVAGGFSIEVHLFDFSGELYGERLRVHLIGKLREEKKFSGIEELKAQIARDAQSARELLLGRVPDPSAGGGWA